jgi:multicomponent Na+:H+ antiporter subunit A
MLTALLCCFGFAILPLLADRWYRRGWSWLAALLPLGLFAYFLAIAGPVAAGDTILQSWPWVPALGVDLVLRLDGLSLLFSLLITGIGTLVFFYASSYMRGDPGIGRLFGWLSLFMGAMLGLVLSDNLITLFIFWELTSISSFFLIGYKQEDLASRRSALTALAITGTGGLALLAAGILMGQMGGSLSLSALAEGPVALQEHPQYVWLLGLVLLAAFTKSAQFPFHFWLPGAMKAPTPVSTYLHSATMVKAGVYLLLRFSPLLGDHPAWTYSLMGVGGFTMLYAAFQGLFRTDLKGILAYSTLSALGILVFLTGMGSDAALTAALTFLLVHALYKAALFLIAGILDHSTGTRDVTRLRGLARAMPMVAVAGVLAALSNAGIPPLFGFVGKDLVYEATLHHAWWAWPLTGAALVTNALLFWAGFQAGWRPFFGSVPAGLPDLHGPDARLWGPPLLLGGLSLLFGLWPGGPGAFLIGPGLKAVGGGALQPLALWHGWGPVLLLSLLTLGLGAVLYLLLPASAERERKWSRWQRLSPEHLFRRGFEGFQSFGKAWTRFFQHGYLRSYILTILIFLSGTMGWLLFTRLKLGMSLRQVLELTIYEVSILVIMTVAVLYTVFTRSRLVAVAALGVVGYALCLVFVFYSAPDLAMTQFSIDTLTVILFVLVLYRLPVYLKLSETRWRIRDGLLASFFGVLIFLLILEVLDEPVYREVGDFYAANAYILAKGKNVVNVILVDYRGLDTLVEISVLVIAAIGVFGLLKLRLKRAKSEAA